MSTPSEEERQLFWEATNARLVELLENAGSWSDLIAEREALAGSLRGSSDEAHRM